MDLILQVLLGWQFILGTSFVVICLLVFICKKYPNVLLGVNGLIQSPSGVFGLLTLGAITFVTLKQPSVGGVAFAAFVSVVPAILSWTEHKETMSGIPQVAPPSPPPPDPPPSDPVTVVVEPQPPDNSAKPVIGSPDAPVA
jgi:hypothetical protein